MKRAKFLGFLSAIVLAPFGIKASNSLKFGNVLPDLDDEPFVTFTANPQDVGKEYYSIYSYATECFSISGPGIGIHKIDLPKDDNYHDVCIRSDGNKIEYFIDGILQKQVMI